MERRLIGNRTLTTFGEIAENPDGVEDAATPALQTETLEPAGFQPPQEQQQQPPLPMMTSPHPTCRSASREFRLQLSGFVKTPVARLLSGDSINCELRGVTHAWDARWRIAASLGTAIARVEISVAGVVLEDSDRLDGRDLEIVLSDRRVEQELVEAVGFRNFENRSKLSIKYARISTLPESICDLRSLRCLDIFETALFDLPGDIGKLSGLQTLKITRTKLCTLPESIGQLQGLHSLTLSYNKLTTLPDTLGELVWLSVLELGHNLLTALPQSFAQLQELHHLDLSYNWLTTLPNDIGLLTWVRKVNVDVNRLTYLPKSIVDLQWLQCLHLEWNQLEEFPAGFCQLVWLRELHLRGNRIAALPHGFGNLICLEVLEIEGNYPKLTVLHVPPRLKRVTF